MDRLRGLYVITPDGFEPDVLEVFVRSPGWCALQYRDKGVSDAVALAKGKKLLRHTRRWGIPLIINDHVWLVEELGAEGLHVGESDGGVAWCRGVLGGSVLLGSSCYNSKERATVAVRDGADYCSFGAFFATPTKPHAPRAGVDLLQWFREGSRFSGVSVFAIGGIEAPHCAHLVTHGADGVCVVRGVLGADDVLGASERYCEQLNL